MLQNQSLQDKKLLLMKDFITMMMLLKSGAAGDKNQYKNGLLEDFDVFA